MTVNKFLILVESEIEKAQIVMAVNSEIVEKLQRDAEKMANMKVDVLGPIVDRIKAEHGIEAAEAFRDTATNILDGALNAVMQAKDQLYTEALKLTGDVASKPTIEDDLGADDVSDIGEFTADDSFSDEDLDFSEPTPVDREVKESVKLGMVVETITNRVGEKYFKTPKEMKEWIAENKNKIKKIHRIIGE